MVYQKRDGNKHFSMTDLFNSTIGFTFEAQHPICAIAIRDIVKIYISATYRDLDVHRRAVSSALRRIDHQVIGKEDYVAEDLRPVTRFFRT